MAKTNQLLLEENKQEKKSEPVSMDTVGVRQTNPTEVGSNCNWGGHTRYLAASEDNIRGSGASRKAREERLLRLDRDSSGFCVF